MGSEMCIRDSVKNGLITEHTAKELLPRGSCLPRLYGLPKTHKENVPMRPILSMVGSPTHKLAQWLASLLDPVAQKLNKFSVPDSFTFVDRIRDTDLRGKFMCSFDVTSLFTCLPLKETVDIIEFVIFDLGLNVPLPVPVLKSLILLCTQNAVSYTHLTLPTILLV